MSRDENSMGPRAISKPAARPRKSNPDAMPRARRLVAVWNAMAATIAARRRPPRSARRAYGRCSRPRSDSGRPDRIDTDGVVCVEINAVAARTSRRRPSTVG